MLNACFLLARIILGTTHFCVYKLLNILADIVYTVCYKVYTLVFKILVSSIVSITSLILGFFVTSILSFLFLSCSTGGLIYLFCAAWYYVPGTMVDLCSTLVTKGAVQFFSYLLTAIAKYLKK